MKVKKILFTIFVFFIGTYAISASGCTGTDYENLLGIYQDLSALSYFHIIYDGTQSQDDNRDTFKADESMVNLYSRTNGNNKSNITLDDIVDLYYDVYLRYGINSSRGLAQSLLNHYGLTGDGTQCTKIKGEVRTDSSGNTLIFEKSFLTLLNERVTSNNEINDELNTIDFLWGLVDGLIYRVITDIDNEETISSEDYKSFKSSIEIAYDDFCDYLNSHKGISGFIETALDIVTYAALALGIFLGILDFMKAISSQEDAALTKAFQSFMKRIAAIALIFLSGVIITMVVNIVPIWGVEREATVCSQFDLGKEG